MLFAAELILDLSVFFCIVQAKGKPGWCPVVDKDGSTLNVSGLGTLRDGKFSLVPLHCLSTVLLVRTLSDKFEVMFFSFLLSAEDITGGKIDDNGVDDERNFVAMLFLIALCEKDTIFLDLEVSEDESEQPEMEEQSALYPPGLLLLAEEEPELLLSSLPSFIVAESYVEIAVSSTAIIVAIDQGVCRNLAS